VLSFIGAPVVAYYWGVPILYYWGWLQAHQVVNLGYGVLSYIAIRTTVNTAKWFEVIPDKHPKSVVGICEPFVDKACIATQYIYGFAYQGCLERWAECIVKINVIRHIHGQICPIDTYIKIAQTIEKIPPRTYVHLPYEILKNVRHMLDVQTFYEQVVAHLFDYSIWCKVTLTFLELTPLAWYPVV
jgi:hypothetical protein